MWTREHEERHEQLRLLKERISDQYLGRDDVTGIGVGFKEVGGRETDELVIRFHVRRKGNVTKDNAIPREIEGVRTDVIETNFETDAMPATVDPIVAEFGPPDTSMYIMLSGGMSVGATRVEKDATGNPIGGTLGLVVLDTATNDPMILSNYHVLCCNDGKDATGNEICQPARVDHGGRALVCATLRAPWAVGTPDGSQYGMDAAVARLTDLRASKLSFVLGVGGVVFVPNLELRPGMVVHKRGRTTKLTYGKIAETNSDEKFDYKGAAGQKTLKNQFLIMPSKSPKGVPYSTFGSGGDSGAVVLCMIKDGKPPAVVGLYWGGSSTGLAIASPIGPILNQLKIRIYSE